MKRRGNRRYYQHHEVLLIRRIRDLLYDQGFTISGARNRLTELNGHRGENGTRDKHGADIESTASASPSDEDQRQFSADEHLSTLDSSSELGLPEVRAELVSIRALLAI
jgi:DNA-binding transcriptional MerR regulator